MLFVDPCDGANMGCREQSYYQCKSCGLIEDEAGHLRRQLAQAQRERDLAIAHDRQPYPTAEAYELVCRSLRAKEAQLAQAQEKLTAAVKRYETAEAERDHAIQDYDQEKDDAEKFLDSVYDLLGMKDDLDFDPVVEAIKKVVAERAALAEAQAIIDRLPKTADGVTVVPGMRLAYTERMGDDGHVYIEECDVCRCWEKRNTSSLPLPTYISERSCYSTRELAEAAEAAKENGNG